MARTRTGTRRRTPENVARDPIATVKGDAPRVAALRVGADEADPDLWLQIVGKMKLSATPKRNHWWHATFQPGVRGLTTGRMRLNETPFAIDFDFVAHELRVRAADGRTESFPLEDGLSVAAFERNSTLRSARSGSTSRSSRSHSACR